ncbi:Uncharacterised protein [Legionella beliardensis]|uniref:Uncharacterized protein n=1 Tax=Legionella beliardensis TaxID=91822 RepID=A0A378JPS2_9GAMM|nr:hypothetical protein [Legionella beliardensis]STX55794.1 Uncharacterised protein [Legionella beliardensis]
MRVPVEISGEIPQQSPDLQENQSKLLVNFNEELPNGKVSKKEIRTPIKRQKGMTCTLYAMRRIAFFNSLADSKSIQAYTELKKALSDFKMTETCFKHLIHTANKIIKDFDLNLEKALIKNLSFMHSYSKAGSMYRFNLSPIEFYNQLDLFPKWVILYSILIQRILAPLFSLQQTDWHPSKGMDALRDSLSKKGAHFFMGKYGTWCYNKPPKEYKDLCTSTRKVLYFDKDSYQADEAMFTHGIIVDQIKNINGKNMVFYRDPNYPSSPGKKEKVFMLSYETFVKRLTDFRGLNFQSNECSSEEKFGLVSCIPEKIYSIR